MHTRKEFQPYEFHIGKDPSTLELFIRQNVLFMELQLNESNEAKIYIESDRNL